MDTIWVVLENIHAYTMGNILEFPGKGGTLNCKSKGMGAFVLTTGIPRAWGSCLEGTDNSVKV